jgi:protein transport protein SEC24
MCNQTNETPHLFDWDQEKNVAADRWQRAELNHSIVEYVAPANYSYRQPQPPMYAFVMDVSQAGVQSGI